jgi:hypothetical protein
LGFVLVFFGFGAGNHCKHSKTTLSPPRAVGTPMLIFRITISRTFASAVAGWTISSGERDAPGRRGSILGSTS